MSELPSDIPYGFCHCGCGKKTGLAACNDRRFGHIKGEPTPFLLGHCAHPKPRYIEEDRGYSTPCWIWQRSIARNGYGWSKRNGKSLQAHRHIYEQAKGPIPAGMHLDHLCRVRACVNPDHLEPVVCAENLRRGLRTKLTAEQVAAIRASVGVHHEDLAQQYGVSRATISMVLEGKNWRDVEAVEAVS